MKKLLILASTLLLSGCVTYYYPEVALEDGVYYAEDDPSYVVDSGGYVAYSSYYPWSSLDYFYLGHYSYPRYGYGYGYGFGYGYDYYAGFSFGIGYSYSPWHTPYYHYPHYYAWRPYHGYHHGNHRYGKKHHKRKGNKRKYRNGNDYRYAGRGDNQRGNRRGEYADDVRSPDGRNKGRSKSSGEQTDSAKRYVSTAPSGVSGSRGMEVRSRGSKSRGKSTTHPVTRVAVESKGTETSNKSVTQNSYRSRRSTGSAGETRYRAGAKQDRARTQPVGSASKSQRYAMTGSPAQSTSASSNNGRKSQAPPVNGSSRSSARSSSGKASGQSPSRSSSRSNSSAKTHQSSGTSRRSQSGSSSSGSRSSRHSKSSHRQSQK